VYDTDYIAWSWLQCQLVCLKCNDNDAFLSELELCSFMFLEVQSVSK
jgi:hypothetical protein